MFTHKIIPNSRIGVVENIVGIFVVQASRLLFQAGETPAPQ
jgi:hypothetical protein